MFVLPGRLPVRLQRLSRAPIRVEVGATTLVVPTGPIAALRTFSRWRPGWKSDVLAAFAERMADGGCVVDVGANIGQTLCDVLAIDRYWHYVGVEPQIECVAYLRAIIERNGLARHEVLPVALGDQAGGARLHSSVGTTLDSEATLDGQLRPSLTTSTTLVPVLPFDSIRSAIDSRIGVVKIDVEGGELATLRGMTQTLADERPPVLCEVLLADKARPLNEYAVTVADLWVLLDGCGYEVGRIDKVGGRLAGVTPIEQFPVDQWTRERADQCDYLFVHRDQGVAHFALR